MIARTDATALNGRQMTRPDNFPGYARQFLLRGCIDRIRPLAYSRARSGIRCLTFHYLFDQEIDRAHSLFAALKKHGDFITTAELLAILESPSPVAGRFFHLSIDDGFRNIATNAHPILRDLAIPYTFFVCPGLLDRGAEGDEQFRVNAGYRRVLPLADWKTLRALADDGVEIGSHTSTHRAVAGTRSDAELQHELVHSRQAIERALGRPCTSFAWPFGRLDAMTAPALSRARAAGYRAIFSSVRGSLVAGQGIPAYLPRHHFEPSWTRSAILYYATRREQCFTVDTRFAF